MSEDYTHRPAKITLPVRTTRPNWPARGARWSATVDLPYMPSGTYGATVDEWYVGDQATEKDARDRLTEFVLAGLVAAQQPIVLVIGGAAPDYHECLHVVRMTARGGHVDIIRAGRHCGSWSSSSKSLDEEVAGVLAHVGGEPTILRLF